jgi:hypothetical protein
MKELIEYRGGVERDERPVGEPKEGVRKRHGSIAGHLCEGCYDFLGEFDCGYGVSFGCEECCFTQEDKKDGKRPWRRKH